MGIDRNLTAGEIAGQVRVLARELGMLDTRFNIVLMGMGEPLHNYEATMKALRILADEHGFGMSGRRMTLSTVGVLPALERLATEPLMPNLAISLHATTEDQRDLLVPINRKYGLKELLDACRRFPLKRRERITFEYVMLQDVNDTPEDARRLVRLLHGIRGKVNLLPLNEAAGIPFARPSDDRVNRFARILAEHGITVSVRKSRGRDIRAACGQLITESSRKAPGARLATLMETS
jgi:23S rRNA (adenine2503-C2)-methyltransferase